MASVRTSIFGRPRRLPSDRRADHLYTLICEEPQTPAGHDIVAVGVDERGYFLCWRSSSAPKKLAALFKISLARFSSRISCSSNFNFAASLVLVPGT
jgi:hypothetical protein